MKKSERLIRLNILFVFLLSCGAASAFSYWKYQSMLEREIQGQLRKAVVSVEHILTNAKQAAGKGAVYAGAGCTDKVLSDLRAYVAAIPEVRSINLAKGNQIYCTTVYGSKTFNVDERKYIDGRLLLLSGNELTPYRSLIVYRATGDNGNSALVGVDGYYLYNVLKQIESQSLFYIKVGHKYMTKDGAVILSPVTETILSQGSLLFPFSVIADTSQIYTLTDFLQYSWDTIVIIIVFSVLNCFLLSRYMLYRKTIVARLNKAIKHGDIYPWIQPIYCAKHETIVGGEILLRWFETGNGFIPPDVFIRLAEENGTLIDLTRACFENTARELRVINSVAPPPLILCFNITASNFLNSEILSLCDDFLREISPDCFQIVLEVTERETITETMQTREIIRLLKERHIALSLDDFGTGNANYSYIKLFSPDYLKIDKMFTLGIETDRVSQFVVASIIDLARKLGCEVIAEGVETERQKEILREMGVTHFQGYYYSKPVPFQEFKEILAYSLRVHSHSTVIDE